ncbi:MAG: extracellular solute-binding protein [Planctomycetota bacterium]|nr:extracellular solute-binding protein [Planctomycetota bacterium]
MMRVVALSVLLLVASCIACAEDTVELQYWTSPYELRAMAEIFEQYQRENPGVKVVIGQSAARNLVDDPQRVLCAIVGGDPPDIIVFDRYAVGEWAARGAFMPLNDEVPGVVGPGGFVAEDARAGDPDAIKEENYYKPCWEEATYKGKLYGIAIGTDNRALYYNKTMLVKAGLVDKKTGAARPPESWNELREYANKLSVFETTGNQRKLKVAGFVPNYGNSWLYIYGWQNGAKFMSDDGRTCLLNEPKVVEALAFMKSMYDDLGGAAAVNAFQSSFQGGELDPFLTGKIAMKIDGNWVLSGIAAYKPDMDFGVCPAPMPDAGQERISWLGGWAWIIPKGAKHPREAWTLIRRLSSVETNMHMAAILARTEAAQGRMYIPGLNANRLVTEALFNKYLKNDPNADPKFVNAMQVFIDLLPRSKYRPVTPVGQLLWNEHVRATQYAILGKMAPQEALDIGTALVQRDLDRVFRPETGIEVRWDHMVMLYFGLLALGTACAIVWFYTRFKGGLQARREAWAGWLFASPWMIGFICFTGGPILCSLVMSFCTYDAMAPSRLVLLRNYQEMFTADRLFIPSLWNTVYMVIGVPLGMAFGLGVALLLDAKVRYMSVYRTLFYLPSIVPGVASALLWLLIFNANNGILNWALEAVGLPRLNWLDDEHTAKPALILQGLWGAGAGMIVWLAGLKEIPTDLYEAAAIDGANVFDRFRHITIPMLTPYIFFNLVMGLIGTFQIFAPAYLMTAGGPADSTLFYAYNLFNQAFRYMHMGYASALAWILFAVVFALTMLQLKMSKRWVHYQGE